MIKNPPKGVFKRTKIMFFASAYISIIIISVILVLVVKYKKDNAKSYAI